MLMPFSLLLVLVLVFIISAIILGSSMTNTHGLIRTIYLYLFALVGLFVLVFSSVNFISGALNRYVWPQEFVQYDYRKPTPALEKNGEVVLTLEQQKEQFVVQQDNEFKRRSTESIPGIVIGWVLWWFHWGWIKRDRSHIVNA